MSVHETNTIPSTEEPTITALCRGEIKLLNSLRRHSSPALMMRRLCRTAAFVLEDVIASDVPAALVDTIFTSVVRRTVSSWWLGENAPGAYGNFYANQCSIFSPDLN
eukprot:15333980-Ditylum_brightwellii.AAC.1